MLGATLENSAGEFLICIISGRLIQIDLDDCIAYDITPLNACLPQTSCQSNLSYLANAGSIQGTGGYLVIYNWPNHPIFVTPQGARVADSRPPTFEMPPARLGTTAGLRAYVIQGNNTLVPSDPFGSAYPLSPLTFNENLNPDEGGGFFCETYTIGNFLDNPCVTAMCSFPVFGESPQEFGNALIISTENSKYFFDADSVRSTWRTNPGLFTQFGSGDGISNSLACTEIHSNIIYGSTYGRYKSLSQDQERNTNFTETSIDEGLGQFLCKNETEFHFRDWYKDLDHSRHSLKFARERLLATAAPTIAPAIDKFGNAVTTPTHRALAVASFDPNSELGETTRLNWEGYYDYVHPVSISAIGDNFYIFDKSPVTGLNRFLTMDFTTYSEEDSVVYTRGYFSSSQQQQQPAKSKTLTEVSLYFRNNPGTAPVTVSYLSNNKWIPLGTCNGPSKRKSYEFTPRAKCRTNADHIPLRVEIHHKGCWFELESIRVQGEGHPEA